ncbi:MAG: response regulator [Nitrospirota bacterium]
MKRESKKEGRRILVATSDKNEECRICRYLSEDMGHKVKVVDDGKEAIKDILGSRVDLAVIDLELNKVPGLGVIDEIKRSKLEIPLIVISGDSTVQTGSRVAEKGVFYYLYKPVEMEMLGEVVDAALKRFSKKGAVKGF